MGCWQIGDGDCDGEGVLIPGKAETRGIGHAWRLCSQVGSWISEESGDECRGCGRHIMGNRMRERRALSAEIDLTSWIRAITTGPLWRERIWRVSSRRSRLRQMVRATKYKERLLRDKRACLIVAGTSPELRRPFIEAAYARSKGRRNRLHTTFPRGIHHGFFIYTTRVCQPLAFLRIFTIPCLHAPTTVMDSAHRNSRAYVLSGNIFISAPA